MRISIVTPSFNRAGFLKQTVRSVLDQVYPDLEYIVMNGGSTDGSREIIRDHEERLAHWESGRDVGQADAVLRGFQRATGDVLGRLNSDDISLPGCLQAAADHFKASPEEECAVGGAVFIDAAGVPLRRAFGMAHSRIGLAATFRMLLIAGCPFCQPASFWRRDAFFEVGGFDTSLRFCFDYDLYLRLAKRRRIAHIPRLLAGFRRHPGSKSSTLLAVKISEDTTRSFTLPTHLARVSASVVPDPFCNDRADGLARTLAGARGAADQEHFVARLRGPRSPDGTEMRRKARQAIPTGTALSPQSFGGAPPES